MPDNKTVTFDASQWQPIETAPKDGRMFLVWVNASKFGEDDEGRQLETDCSQVDFAEWRTEGDVGWVDYFAHPFADQEYATHWMPLPAAPGSTPAPAAQSAGQEAVFRLRKHDDDFDVEVQAATFNKMPKGDYLLYAAPVTGGERVQWWLADIDMHGNPTLSDGAHSDRAGADKAAYLHAALGLKHDRKFAVARVELFEPKPNAEGVNHEAVSQCNAMSERAADVQQVGGDARVAELEAMLTEVTDCLAWLNSDDDGHIMALTDRARAALAKARGEA